MLFSGDIGNESLDQWPKVRVRLHTHTFYYYIIYYLTLDGRNKYIINTNISENTFIKNTKSKHLYIRINKMLVPVCNSKLQVFYEMQTKVIT